MKLLFTKKVLSAIMTLSSMKNLLWPTHWFWYKRICRNKKANNKSRQRLYYRMFVGLWWYQRSLLIWVDKKIDADPNAIQQIEFVGQSDNNGKDNNDNNDNR